MKELEVLKTAIGGTQAQSKSLFINNIELLEKVLEEAKNMQKKPCLSLYIDEVVGTPLYDKAGDYTPECGDKIKNAFYDFIEKFRTGNLEEKFNFWDWETPTFKTIEEISVLTSNYYSYSNGLNGELMYRIRALFWKLSKEIQPFVYNYVIEELYEKSLIPILMVISDKKMISERLSYVKYLQVRLINALDWELNTINSDLPKELQTEEAKRLFEKTIKVGFMKNDFSFIGTNRQRAFYAELASQRLNIKKKRWAVFEKLWNMKGLAQYSNETKDKYGNVPQQEFIEAIFYSNKTT